MSDSNSSSSMMNGGSAVAPKLKSGADYATWRPLFINYCMRLGLETVLEDKVSSEEWIAVGVKISEWSGASIFSRAISGAASSSSSIGLREDPSSLVPSSEQLLFRKEVRAACDRSKKTYALLYEVMPVELRPQVAHIPTGLAYELWKWLETKFQSTEADNVSTLFMEWAGLTQAVGESFDAYRARVNKISVLLDAAGEKPSPRMYAFTLLDKLQPFYSVAVLALKAGKTLDDATNIDWNKVTAFVNTHERNAQRSEEEGGASPELGMAAIGGSNGGRRGFQKGNKNNPQQRSPLPATTKPDARGCFNCASKDHIMRYCPRPKRSQQQASEQAASAMEGDTNPEIEEQFGFSAILVECPTKAYVSHGNTYAEVAMGVANLTARRPAVNRATATSSVSASSASAANQGSAASSASPTVAVEQPATALKRLKRPGEFSQGASLPAAAAASPRPLPAPASSMAKKKPAEVEREPLLPYRSQAAEAAAAAVPAPRFNKQSIEASLASSAWGVDSMASCHITGNRTLLSGVRTVAPVIIKVADGADITVTQKGTTSFRVSSADGIKQVNVVVEDVYYHERFTANLLSMGVLRQLGWEYHSTLKETYVITKGKTKVMCSNKGRVSILETVSRERVYAAISPVAYRTVDDLVRLHEQLAHVSFNRMIEAVKSGKIEGVGSLTASTEVLAESKRVIMTCEACAKGKLTKTALGHKGIDHGEGPFRVIHLDTFEATGLTHKEYGVMMYDPFTLARWFVKVSFKSEIPSTVVTLLKRISTQVDVKLRQLVSDGGSEFINAEVKEYLHGVGAVIKPPPPRTPQLNGISERGVRTLKDGARTIMMHAGLPARFWPQATRHFVYMWNRIRISQQTGVTPFEAMSKKKPSLARVGVFGSDVWVHRSKNERHTYDSKADAGVYLGHDDNQSCAVVYILRTQEVIRTKDLKYRVSFNHSRALSAGDAEVQVQMDLSVPELLSSESTVVQELPDGHMIEGGPSQLTPPGGVVSNSGGNAATTVTDESDTDSDEFQIEKIVGKSGRGNNVRYEVKWLGYDESENTWHRMSDLTNAMDLVQEYEDKLNGISASHSGIVQMVFSAIGSETANSAELLPGSTDAERMELAQAVVSASNTTEEYRITPETFQEAMKSVDAEKWMASMQKEIDSCESRRTWIKVVAADLPKGTNILKCKWVYKLKTDSNDTVTEYKSRLTPKGFMQKEGVDYFESFARTGMYKTMRLGLALAALWDYELDQLDVPSAFLWADLHEDVYMELPEGFKLEGFVLKLLKALYGLKQAPRNWYILVSTFIKEKLGFIACVSDPCLFYKRSANNRLIFLFLFVDDFQAGYHPTDKQEWNQYKEELKKEYNTKDMGPSTWILGMRISRDRVAGTITLDQELYVTKALSKFGLTECRTYKTPAVSGNEVNNENEDGAGEATDRGRFMEIVGTLLYAAISTRPDIAHAVHKLTRVMQSPVKRDMIAAERVLRYLAGTKSIGLVFGAHRSKSDTMSVSAFADADWANDKSDRKSVTGWVAKLNGDVISWASKKQPTVAQSTCEAELYAEAAAANEVLWIRGILGELGLEVDESSVIHGDNRSTIAVSENGGKSERTKHVDIKYHFIHDQINLNAIKLQWVPTGDQQADIFTKSLGAPEFSKFRAQLMTA